VGIQRAADEAALVSTHISHVLLLGDRAYKVRRRVRFPFLDQTDVQARRRVCEAEVRLNRRLAPDVYLGVAELVGVGIDEPVVVMKRMPSERNLALAVSEGRSDLKLLLRQIAHRLASFHEGADRAIPPDGSWRSMLVKWASSLEEIAPHVGRILGEERYQRIRRQSEAYLRGRGPLFDHRDRRGFSRDIHGDVKADDIFCLDDGPRILDCLEFDDALRCADVLEDVASLTMDLERLGRPDLSTVFSEFYREYTNDHAPKSLEHHYIAYRALVRCKVACISASEGIAGAEDQARLLLALTDTHLARGTVRLVLAGGLPGVGKSTLAAEICAGQGWTLLSSDSVRREVYGSDGSRKEPFGQGIYDRGPKEIVYTELLHRAEYLLGHGESVVLDATWNDAGHRASARDVASRTCSGMTEIECRAPMDIAAIRIRERSAGPTLSDADAETARRLADDFDAWPQAVTLDTTGETVSAVERLFAGPLGREPSVLQVALCRSRSFGVGN
jgi:uncharacterized protein